MKEWRNHPYYGSFLFAATRANLVGNSELNSRSRGYASSQMVMGGGLETETILLSPALTVLSSQSIRNALFEGDCLDVLGRLPESSVDMVLCDLPYGTTQNKWDCVIDLAQLWAALYRVVRKDGAIVLSSQGVFTAKLILSNEKDFKYKLCWEKSKPTNFLNVTKQPLRKHEDICVFYQNQPTYNPQMGEGGSYDKGVRKDQLSGSYGDFSPHHVKSDGGRYPTDVIYFKTAESEGQVWHPTQKPVALGQYLIRTYSNPGDLILDCAFGSGSFLIAAAIEGRDFCGIEKNEDVQLFKTAPVDYLDVACSRLSEIPFWSSGSRKVRLYRANRSV